MKEQGCVNLRPSLQESLHPFSGTVPQETESQPLYVRVQRLDQETPEGSWLELYLISVLAFEIGYEDEPSSKIFPHPCSVPGYLSIQMSLLPGGETLGKSPVLFRVGGSA